MSDAAPVSVLVVNDREEQLMAISAVLEPLGHRVVTAASGEDALRRLLQDDYAVLLLDVNMPGMNGFEIAEAIRSRPRLEQLPIIFVTATNQGAADHLRGYETGAIDYVHVPVDPAIIRAKVTAFVRMHRLNQEIRRQAADLARLNQTLQEQAAQLSAANDDLEAFSYSVSHDLRAPVRVIDQFGAILEQDQGPRLDDEGRRLVTRMRANAKHMGQLIEDLIELSRVSRSGMSRHDLDITAMAQAVVDGLRQQDSKRQVEFDIQPGMTAKADPGMVRTLLANLIGNAWKYTGKKDVARIAVTCSPTVQHQRTFAVRDNGAGFDMANATKLFAPFQRLHAASEFAGSGIGLSIVGRIIRRHGGKIWAEAVPDQGATFHFTLEA